MDTVSNPINIAIAVTGITGRDLVGVLPVVTLVAIGLKLFGLLPVPTLSNKHLIFVLFRVVFHGGMPRGCRTIIRAINFTILVTVVILVTTGSVVKLFE